MTDYTEIESVIDMMNALEDGDRVMIYPNSKNPIHRAPVEATFSGGYLYCDGTDRSEVPDYYWRDATLYISKMVFLS